MKKKITPELILTVTIILLLVTVFLMGGGHGTYISAKLFYPYTMILAYLFGSINFLGIIIAIGQIPFYGWILLKRPKFKGYLIAIHILALLICFSINDTNFA